MSKFLFVRRGSTRYTPYVKMKHTHRPYVSCSVRTVRWVGGWLEPRPQAHVKWRRTGTTIPVIKHAEMSGHTFAEMEKENGKRMRIEKGNREEINREGVPAKGNVRGNTF